MTVHQSLDRKLQKFLDETLNADTFQDLIIGNLYGDVDSLFEKIKVFIFSFTNSEHRQYIILKIIYFIRDQQYSELMAHNKNNISGETKVFGENRQSILDDMAIIADTSGISLNEEHLTKEEIQNLIQAVKNMSGTLEYFIARQNAANEVIFNTVDHFMQDMTSAVGKTRIFGKKFTMTTILSRVALLTANTAFGYGLEKTFDNIPEFIEKMNAGLQNAKLLE